MRKLLVFSFILCLAACGFRPLYQNTNTLGGGTSVLDDVWIDSIPNKAGVYMRNALIDRFYNNGTPADPHFVLQVSLIESERGLAIQKDSTSTRAQWVIRATYQLLKKETREAVDTGEVRAVSSFNILSSQYTTLVTQQEAENTALTDLADKLTMRMAFVLQNPSKASLAKAPETIRTDALTSSALNDPASGIGIVPGQR